MTRTLDFTHPSRWPEQRSRGRIAFQVRYGLLAVGVPLAVLVDLALILSRRDTVIFFTAHHVLQLALVTAIVAPVVGLFVGRMLWQVGERRLGDRQLTREFLERSDLS